MTDVAGATPPPAPEASAAPAPAPAAAPAPTDDAQEEVAAAPAPHSSSSSDDDQDDDERTQLVQRKFREFFEAYGLSPFATHMAMSWAMRAADGTEELQRVRRWLLQEMNGGRRPADTPVAQRACPEIIPGLRALPFWPASAHSEPMRAWLAALQEAASAVRAEVLALRDSEGTHGFQPYRAPSWAADTRAADGVGTQGTDAGDWNVYYLHLHNVDFAANRARCPVISGLIDALPPAANYHHAFISALAPDTHITPHHGPTNKKLRVHLPLFVPAGGLCRLRAADEVHVVADGEVFVFDDSFEHEAWNSSSEVRIHLIIDVWHPDLHPQEIKFLQYLQKASLRNDKKRAEGDSDSFYGVLAAAAELSVDSSLVFPSSSSSAGDGEGAGAAVAAVAAGAAGDAGAAEDDEGAAAAAE